MTHPYGARLFDEHAKLLADSAISPEVAGERGYVSVDTRTRLEQAGFAKSQRLAPGLLIPIHATDGEIRLHQYRPDSPRLNGEGKPVKYETPFRHELIIDVPPRVRDKLGDISVPLLITEGARKADAAVTAGLCCVAILGVNGWTRDKQALPDWRDIALKDRLVYVAFDSDVMTKREVKAALKALSGFLEYRDARVQLIYLPQGEAGAKTGLDDYLTAGHAVDELLALARPPIDRQPPPAQETPPETPQPPAPSSLEATVAVFKRWLYLEDPAPLYALAATLVANRAPGDPVWLLLVCAPSTGKTEMLSAAARLPWVISAAKVTESSLLSGTSTRERAKDATGGLLRQVGDFGVILAKDFTSVLAQNKDTRAEALAALREVYDGRWDRPVGSDGGRTLTWQGKCGLIGGVTPALDRYSQVVSTLGDRFILLRLPDAKVEEFGQAALAHGEREATMRRELRESLAGLVEHADIGKVNRPLEDRERDRLITLAAYTARARTAVDRDGYRREILYLPQVEGPGRLVKAYARLLGGLEAIGCDQATAWCVVVRVAIDSAPALRTSIIRVLLDADHYLSTAAIADAVGVVSDTAKLHLEDLSLLELAEYIRDETDGRKPYLWKATKWLADHYPKVSDDKYHPSPSPSGRDEKGVDEDGANSLVEDPVPTPPYFSSETSGGDICPGCDSPYDSVWHENLCGGDEP